MSQDAATGPIAAQDFFDAVLEGGTPTLQETPDLSEDEIFSLTRKIRIRQIAADLNEHKGQMPSDPEERKIFLSQLKDLDNQAAKIKMIGVKEKTNAADALAADAVQRMLKLMGDNPMRRTPVAASTARPSIDDAVELAPLELVPDETYVGLDGTTYDELMERTGNA